MTGIDQKKQKSVWWKLILFFLLLGIGGVGGYKLYEKGNDVGCFQLQNDLFQVEIKQNKSDHLRLLAVGDTGTGNSDQLAVAEGMANVCEKSGCDLVLLLGDNFYPNGVSSIMDSQFYSKFELVYQKLKIPFFVVLGNHDVKQDGLAQLIYSMKSNSWSMPNYEYSFKSTVARFYGLNTSCPFSFERLRRKLNTDADEIIENANKLSWTIVFGHHSVYSNGTHGDTDFVTRAYWNRILNRRVDLYLSGHNHNLAHLKPENFVTEFVVSGAGGANYKSTTERGKLNKSVANTLFSYNDNGFVWLDITSEKLNMRFHDSNGKTIYEYTKFR